MGNGNRGSADPDNGSKQQCNNMISMHGAASARVWSLDSAALLSVPASLSLSLQEMYSKGMILASAIKQVRGHGDNRFEVTTSLRTFVFRAEREGTASHPAARLG